MNKKVIAMAVTAALAAPLAAQASDLKISGRVASDLVNNSAGTAFSDSGQSRLQFDVSDESGWFARYAQDIRLGRLQGEIANVVALTPKFATDRDFYVGTKLGGGSIKFGRITNVGANLEKDAFIGTFLQLRGGALNSSAYGSASFMNNNIQYKMKTGGMNIGVDYILPDSASDQGHYGLALSGKAGSMGYYVGLNNGNAGTAGATGGVTKAGIRMPLGGMDLAVGYDSTDDSSTATDKIHVGVGMKMGGGLLDVTFADKGADGTNAYYRVGFKKKASDSVIWQAGLVQNGSAGSNDQAIGAGVTVKF